MDKSGTLTISNFPAGIADSPLFGIAKMQGLEIREKPGIAKICYSPALQFTPASLPTAVLKDSFGNTYFGCQSGQFYVVAGTGANLIGTVTDPQKQTVYDMKLISDGTNAGEYVLITSQSRMAIYGPTSSGGAALFQEWLNGSASFSTQYGHPVLIGLDVSTNNTPYVYIGNGNVISAVSNFVSSAVGTAPTASWNQAALTLSPGHYTRCLAPLGKYLAIGTQGGSSYADSINSKTAGLFLWDRTSPTFNLPVLFNENGVNQMIQLQNRLVMVVGSRGKIYITDSTNYEMIRRIPFTTNRQFGTQLFLYANAISQHLGEIVIGLSSTNPDGFSSLGIYSLNIDDPKYPVCLKYIPSSGGNGSTQTLVIGSILSSAVDTLYFGWQDGGTFGLDIIGNNPHLVYTNFLAKFESEFYTVGTQLAKTTFKRQEISLTKPLVAGQQIRISYRENSEDNYLLLGTYTNVNFGTNNVYNTIANLASKVKLQFLVELTQATTLTYPSNIELESISYTQKE